MGNEWPDQALVLCGGRIGTMQPPSCDQRIDLQRENVIFCRASFHRRVVVPALRLPSKHVLPLRPTVAAVRRRGGSSTRWACAGGVSEARTRGGRKQKKTKRRKKGARLTERGEKKELGGGEEGSGNSEMR